MTQAIIAAIHPTTAVQQGFLLGTLTRADTAVFVEQAVFPITGELDMPRLQQAFTALIDDHEVLRTGFAWELAGPPRQVVLASPTAAALTRRSSRTPWTRCSRRNATSRST
jgi:hypothetical protein